MPYTYKYPRPALTVDALVFGCNGTAALQVLLIQRLKPPFENSWALPGGFVDMDEDLATAALRELQEETGLQGISLRQLQTFGAPNRDPRGRTVSVVHYGLVHVQGQRPRAADDARDARWFGVHKLPPLAFDHGQIIKTGLERLRRDMQLQLAGHLPPLEGFEAGQLGGLLRNMNGFGK